MTWVRYDDQASIHRKVAPLDDATYRLWREATEWCARNLTDGRIAADELGSISKRATEPRATKLVERDLWHPAGRICGSEHCPPSGPDGWVVHDYLDYQPSRAKVVAEHAAKAERQKRWLERRKKDASQPASHDASKDDAPSPSPSPPRREAGTGVPEKRPAADHAYGAAEHGKKRCPTCGNTLDSAYHRNTCQATLSA